MQLVAFALLAYRSSPTEGKFAQETLNRYNRGVQTFDPAPETNKTESFAQTTLRPLPSTYTVVDWRRFYPFGEKFREPNATEAATTTTSTTTEQSIKSASPPENQLLYPVYIRVPIRVPLKAYAPKIVMPRTVRGTKNVPYRYKVPPRYMMVKHLPIRRTFVSYYSKPYYKYKKQHKYVKPLYQKTSVHDLYKKNMYYSLQGPGYQVMEPKMDDPQHS